MRRPNTPTKRHRVVLALLRAGRRIGWLGMALALGAAPCGAADDGLAPDWSLETAQGAPVQFHSEARGAPAVLMFWTSWCPHCRTLLPVVQAVQDEFAARGVHVYALDIWEDGDAVAYFRDHGLTMPLVLTADLVAEDYGVKHTPTIVVTDAALQRHRLDLAHTTPDQVGQLLRAELSRLLAASSAR